MKLKVILRKDIPNLGITGDLKEVTPGYARNFLLPKKLASLATAQNLKVLEGQKEKWEEERKGKLASAEEQAKKIQDVVLKISANAGKDGKLYGSVTSSEVAQRFMEKGISVDRHWIELREVIRTTGEFSGVVRLHPQVRASFKVQVDPIG